MCRSTWGVARASAVQPCGPNRSFDWVGIDKGFFGFVGTSASSPDMAGLLALKIQFLGSRLGNENFDLYALSAKQAAGGPTVFRQDIPGSNGAFQTTKKAIMKCSATARLVGTAFLGNPNMKAAGDPQDADQSVTTRGRAPGNQARPFGAEPLARDQLKRAKDTVDLRPQRNFCRQLPPEV